MSNRRRAQLDMQDKVTMFIDHPSVSATTAIKIFKAYGRKFRIDAVRYVNPTGLTGDNTNDFSGAISNATTTTTIATLFNTDTNDVPAGVSLPANTFVDGVIVDGTQVLAVDDELSIVLTKEGTQTLPAGRLQIEGRYL